MTALCKMTLTLPARSALTLVNEGLLMDLEIMARPYSVHKPEEDTPMRRIVLLPALVLR